ncbi:putative PTS IIA-like nitrogen-regulatory protein PtsN [Chthoniobacter flavus Ellin428]|uniref:Putative PTS IIA-like nitrogen-regulatory protein PtsN n=1 Tax=Chthoniobacter flavus Ellin428 TaxID=497964 RepID=B4D8Y6_9BACT|nr:PTS sugar transporter subunit IIA [Chthoniobacter flavus]EDY17031.1 putative PTS IIA-like nitrogen-regulatory protein PtsN [Chthoniobacter flavus Ellin428]
MITIADLLRPDHIALQTRAKDPKSAIDEVAGLLKSVPAVLDFQALLKGVQSSAPCLPEPGGGFALCIPHTRGECVNEMVMSVGRSEAGIVFPNVELPVRYVFCIAVPRALAADYLRIVGLLARVFKDRTSEAELRAATTGTEFVDLLSRREAKL